eukprot:scaffold24_cov245-Pinguiococcus_pyrenoidosus.AAC.2
MYFLSVPSSVRVSSSRIPMCFATCRARCSCLCATALETPRQAIELPGNARWQSAATTDESTPPEYATMFTPWRLCSPICRTRASKRSTKLSARGLSSSPSAHVTRLRRCRGRQQRCARLKNTVRLDMGTPRHSNAAKWRQNGRRSRGIGPVGQTETRDLARVNENGRWIVQSGWKGSGTRDSGPGNLKGRRPRQILSAACASWTLQWVQRSLPKGACRRPRF